MSRFTDLFSPAPAAPTSPTPVAAPTPPAPKAVAPKPPVRKVEDSSPKPSASVVKDKKFEE